MTKSRHIRCPDDWTLEQRLLDGRVIVDGCWLWRKGLFADGYGCLNYRGKALKVHRVSASIYLSLDPDSNVLALHRCPNRHRHCFNPDHLYLGTKKDNSQDCIKDGMNHSLNVTHCPQGHAYTTENTYVSPICRRHCRTCEAERQHVAAVNGKKRLQTLEQRRDSYVRHREGILIKKKAYYQTNRDTILSKTMARYWAKKNGASERELE